MLSKDDIRDSLIHEYLVIKQLVAKIPAGTEDYRFSPPQRSTLELVRYLLLLGPGILHAANDNGFAWFQENSGNSASVSLAEAPDYLDGAMAEMKHLFAGWSEDEFATREVKIEGMGEWRLQSWVLNTACKFIPAYKLQLFHHAKASGNTAIDIWDAWFDTGAAPRPSA